MAFSLYSFLPAQAQELDPGTFQVLIYDWYSCVTDPSYETFYGGVVSHHGYDYSQVTMYYLTIRWAEVGSNEITLSDKLRAGLDLTLEVVESTGAHEVVPIYNEATGDLSLLIQIDDEQSGSVRVRWIYNGPRLEPDLFKNPPRVSRAAGNGKTSNSMKISNTVSSHHLDKEDKLSYIVRQTYLKTFGPSHPSLLGSNPEPTDLHTGEGDGVATWWYVTDTSTQPGSYPMEDYSRPVRTLWGLEEYHEYQLWNYFGYRYVGDGNDIPVILRNGSAVPDVAIDDINDKIQGWESVQSWPWQQLEGLVRSTYNINILQGDVTEGELVIYNPSVRSNIVYATSDPTELRYRLILSAWVNDIDGFEDIDYVKVICPDGTVFFLEDEWYGWGDHPPNDGEYFAVVSVDYPMTGSFTFEAGDYEGNVVTVDAELHEWLPTLTYVSPEADETVPDSSQLSFSWDIPVDPSEIDAYEVRLGREDEDEFWRVWTDENSIAYDGAPLEPGAYWWFVSADTVRGNSIHAFTHFWIGPELRMWDLKVQSATKYDNDGSPEVIPEQLALAAKVFDVHGYQDVTVEVTLPTGGVVTLVDIEWVGSDYEAEYILDLQVETILAGSFTFTARDTHGNEVSQAVHFDTWYLEPLTYVSPDYTDVVPSSGELVFDWDPAGFQKFKLHLGQEGEPWFWIRECTETPYVYDEPPLEDGKYICGLNCFDEGNNQIGVFTSFTIGPELQMYDLKVESRTRYDNDGTPEVTPELLVLAAKVFDVHGYQDVTVEVTLPDNTVISLEDTEWVGSEYEAEYVKYLLVDYTVEGTFTFVAYDNHGNEVSQEEYEDTWHLEPLTYVSPDHMEVVPSFDQLVFDWDPAGFQVFVAAIAMEGEPWFWEKECPGPTCAYDGPPLEDGVYVWGLHCFDENWNQIVVITRFIIGPELQIHDAQVNSNILYSTDDPSNTHYRLWLSVEPFDVDGLGDITYWKLTAPNGDVFYLDDENPGDETFDAGLFISAPWIGEFTYEVGDSEGNVALATCWLDEWLVPFEWVSPAYGEEVQGGGPIEFSWNIPFAEIEHYGFHIGVDEPMAGEFFMTTTTETSYIYDETVLEDGSYWWMVSASSPNGNDVHAFTDFAMGPRIHIIHTEIQSHVFHSTQWGTTEFRLWLSATAQDIDGVEDIEYMTVLLDGVELKRWTPDETGRFSEVLFYEAPLSGEFVFQAVDYEGHVASESVYFDEWIWPIESLSPTSGEFQAYEPLVFDWSLTDPSNIDHYEVRLGGELDEPWTPGFWQDYDAQPEVTYPGSLAPGEYWWVLIAESNEGNILEVLIEFGVIA